jgi:hypothetical protein
VLLPDCLRRAAGANDKKEREAVHGFPYQTTPSVYGGVIGRASLRSRALHSHSL